jgi:hypothetical protein
MPTNYYIVEELQTYLVAQGVGQLPNAAPSATVPSIWIQPRDGARLPGKPRGSYSATAAKVETTTITLTDTQTGSPMNGGLEAYLDEAFIDVIVRSKTAAPGKLVHRTIRGLLHPTGDLFGKKGWTMNSVFVEYSNIWRAEQALPTLSTDGEVQTYDRVASYRIGARRANLTA